MFLHLCFHGFDSSCFVLSPVFIAHVFRSSRFVASIASMGSFWLCTCVIFHTLYALIVCVFTCFPGISLCMAICLVSACFISAHIFIFVLNRDVFIVVVACSGFLVFWCLGFTMFSGWIIICYMLAFVLHFRSIILGVCVILFYYTDLLLVSSDQESARGTGGLWEIICTERRFLLCCLLRCLCCTTCHPPYWRGKCRQEFHSVWERNAGATTPHNNRAGVNGSLVSSNNCTIVSCSVRTIPTLPIICCCWLLLVCVIDFLTESSVMRRL